MIPSVFCRFPRLSLEADPHLISQRIRRPETIPIGTEPQAKQTEKRSGGGGALEYVIRGPYVSPPPRKALFREASVRSLPPRTPPGEKRKEKTGLK